MSLPVGLLCTHTLPLPKSEGRGCLRGGCPKLHIWHPRTGPKATFCGQLRPYLSVAPFAVKQFDMALLCSDCVESFLKAGD